MTFLKNVDMVMAIFGIAVFGIVALTTLVGFLAGFKRELKWTIALVILLALVWIFADSKVILDVKLFGFISDMLNDILGVSSGTTLREILNGFIAGMLEGVLPVSLEAETATYILINDVLNAVVRIGIILVGTLVVLILMGIVRLFAGWVRGIVWLCTIDSRRRRKLELANAPVYEEVDNTIIVESEDNTDEILITVAKNPRKIYRGKRRLWGAGLGFVKGLLLVCMLCMPIGGLLSVVEVVDKESYNKIEELLKGDNGTISVSSDSGISLSLLLDYAEAFNDSYVGKILDSSKYFFGKSADVAMFDSIFKIDTDKSTIYLREDIVAIAKIANILLPKFDSSKALPIDIWALGEGELDELFSCLKAINLLPAAMPAGIEVAQSLDFVKDILEPADLNLDGLLKINWDTNLDAIFDAVRHAVRLGNFLEEDFDYFGLDVSVLEDVVNALGPTEFMAVVMPVVINAALHMAFVQDLIGPWTGKLTININWQNELNKIVAIYGNACELLDGQSLGSIDIMALMNDILTSEDSYKTLQETMDLLAHLGLLTQVGLPVIDFALDNGLLKMDEIDAFFKQISLSKLTADDWGKDFDSLLEMAKIIAEMGILSGGEIDLADSAKLEKMVNLFFDLMLLSNKISDDASSSALAVKTLLVDAALKQFNLFGTEESPFAGLTEEELRKIDWEKERIFFLEVVKQVSKLDGILKANGWTLNTVGDHVFDLLDIDEVYDIILDLLNAFVDSSLVEVILPYALDTFVQPIVDGILKDGEETFNLFENINSGNMMAEIFNLVYIFYDVIEMNALAVLSETGSVDLLATAFIPEDGNFILTESGYAPVADTLALVDIIERIFDSEILEGREAKLFRLILAIFLDVRVNVEELEALDYSGDANSMKATLIEAIILLKPVLGITSDNLLVDGKLTSDFSFLYDEVILNNVLDGVSKLLELDLIAIVVPEYLNQVLLDESKSFLGADLVNSIKTYLPIASTYLSLEGITGAELVEDLVKLIDMVRVIVDMGIVELLKSDFKEMSFENIQNLVVALDIFLDTHLMSEHLDGILSIVMDIVNLDVEVDFSTISVRKNLETLHDIFQKIVDLVEAVDIDNLSELTQISDYKTFLSPRFVNPTTIDLVADILEYAVSFDFLKAMLPALFDKFVVEAVITAESSDELKALVSLYDLDLVLADLRSIVGLIRSVAETNLLEVYFEDELIDYDLLMVQIQQMVTKLFSINFFAVRENEIADFIVSILGVDAVPAYGYLDFKYDGTIIAEALGYLLPILKADDFFVKNFSDIEALFSTFEIVIEDFITYDNVLYALDFVQALTEMRLLDGLYPALVEYVRGMLPTELASFGVIFDNYTSFNLRGDIVTILDAARIALDFGLIDVYNSEFKEISFAKIDLLPQIVEKLLSLRLIEKNYETIVALALDEFLSMSVTTTGLDWRKEVQMIVDVINVIVEIIQYNGIDSLATLTDFIDQLDFADLTTLNPYLNNETVYKVLDIIAIILQSNSLYILTPQLLTYVNFTGGLGSIINEAAALNGDYTIDMLRNDLLNVLEAIKKIVSFDLIDIYINDAPINFLQNRELLSGIEMLFGLDFFDAKLNVLIEIIDLIFDIDVDNIDQSVISIAQDGQTLAKIIGTILDLCALGLVEVNTLDELMNFSLDIINTEIPAQWVEMVADIIDLLGDFTIIQGGIAEALAVAKTILPAEYQALLEAPYTGAQYAQDFDTIASVIRQLNDMNILSLLSLLGDTEVHLTDFVGVGSVITQLLSLNILDGRLAEIIDIALKATDIFSLNYNQEVYERLKLVDYEKDFQALGLIIDTLLEAVIHLGLTEFYSLEITMDWVSGLTSNIMDLVTQDNFGSIVTVLDSLINLQLVDVFFLPAYNTFLQGKLSFTGSSAIFTLINILLGQDYIENGVLQDVRDIVSVIKTLSDYGVLDMALNNAPINWWQLEEIAYAVEKLFGLYFFNTYLNDVIDALAELIGEDNFDKSQNEFLNLASDGRYLAEIIIMIGELMKRGVVEFVSLDSDIVISAKAITNRENLQIVLDIIESLSHITMIDLGYKIGIIFLGGIDLGEFSFIFDEDLNKNVDIRKDIKTIGEILEIIINWDILDVVYNALSSGTLPAGYKDIVLPDMMDIYHILEKILKLEFLDGKIEKAVELFVPGATPGFYNEHRELSYLEEFFTNANKLLASLNLVTVNDVLNFNEYLGKLYLGDAADALFVMASDILGSNVLKAAIVVLFDRVLKGMLPDQFKDLVEIGDEYSYTYSDLINDLGILSQIVREIGATGILDFIINDGEMNLKDPWKFAFILENLFQIEYLSDKLDAIIALVDEMLGDSMDLSTINTSVINLKADGVALGSFITILINTFVAETTYLDATTLDSFLSQTFKYKDFINVNIINGVIEALNKVLNLTLIEGGFEFGIEFLGGMLTGELANFVGGLNYSIVSDVILLLEAVQALNIPTVIETVKDFKTVLDYPALAEALEIAVEKLLSLQILSNNLEGIFNLVGELAGLDVYQFVDPSLVDLGADASALASALGTIVSIVGTLGDLYPSLNSLLKFMNDFELETILSKVSPETFEMLASVLVSLSTLTIIDGVWAYGKEQLLGILPADLAFILNNYEATNVKHDLASIGMVVELLKKLDAYRIIREHYDLVGFEVLDNLPEIVTLLLNLDALKGKMPEIIDYVLSVTGLEIVGYDLSEIDWASEKAVLIDVVTYLVELINATDYSNVGQIIDLIHDGPYLSPAHYKDEVVYLALDMVTRLLDSQVLSAMLVAVVESLGVLEAIPADYAGLATLYDGALIIEDVRAILEIVRTLYDLHAVTFSFQPTVSFTIELNNIQIDYDVLIGSIAEVIEKIFGLNYLDYHTNAIVDLLETLVGIDGALINQGAINWSQDGAIIASALIQLIPVLKDAHFPIVFFGDIISIIDGTIAFDYNDFLTHENVDAVTNFLSEIIEISLLKASWSAVADLLSDGILPADYTFLIENLSYNQLISDLRDVVEVLRLANILDWTTLIESNFEEMNLTCIEVLPLLLETLLSLNVLEGNISEIFDLVVTIAGLPFSGGLLDGIYWLDDVSIISEFVQVLVDVIQTSSIEELSQIYYVIDSLDLAAFDLLKTEKILAILGGVIELTRLQALASLLPEIYSEYIYPVFSDLDLTGYVRYSDYALMDVRNILNAVYNLVAMNLATVEFDGVSLEINPVSGAIDFEGLISVLQELVIAVIGSTFMETTDAELLDFISSLTGIDLSMIKTSRINWYSDAQIIADALFAFLPALTSKNFTIKTYNDLLDLILGVTEFNLDLILFDEALLSALTFLLGITRITIIDGVYDYAIDFVEGFLPEFLSDVFYDYSSGQLKRDLATIIEVAIDALELDIIGLIQSRFEDMSFVNFEIIPSLLGRILETNLVYNNVDYLVKYLFDLLDIELNADLRYIDWETDVTHLVSIFGIVIDLVLSNGFDWLNDVYRVLDTMTLPNSLFDVRTQVKLVDIVDELLQLSIVEIVFEDVFNAYLKDILDSLGNETLTSLIPSNLIISDIRSLLPIVKQLLELDLVSFSFINGVFGFDVSREDINYDRVIEIIQDLVVILVNTNIVDQKLDIVLDLLEEVTGIAFTRIDKNIFDINQDAIILSDAIAALRPLFNQVLWPIGTYRDLYNIIVGSVSFEYDFISNANLHLGLEAVSVLLDLTFIKASYEQLLSFGYDVLADFAFILDLMTYEKLIEDLHTVLQSLDLALVMDIAELIRSGFGKMSLNGKEVISEIVVNLLNTNIVTENYAGVIDFLLELLELDFSYSLGSVNWTQEADLFGEIIALAISMLDNSTINDFAVIMNLVISMSLDEALILNPANYHIALEIVNKLLDSQILFSLIPELYDHFVLPLLEDLELGDLAKLYPTAQVIADIKDILAWVDKLIDLDVFTLGLSSEEFNITLANKPIDYAEIVGLVGELVQIILSTNLIDNKQQALIDYLGELLEIDLSDIDQSLLDWEADGAIIANALLQLVPIFEAAAWPYHNFRDLQGLIDGTATFDYDFIRTSNLGYALDFVLELLDLNLIKAAYDFAYDLALVNIPADFEFILNGLTYQTFISDLEKVLHTLKKTLVLDIVGLINSGFTEMSLINIDVLEEITYDLLTLDVLKRTYKDLIEYGLALLELNGTYNLNNVVLEHEASLISQVVGVLVKVLNNSNLDYLSEILSLVETLSFGSSGLLQNANYHLVFDIIDILLDSQVLNSLVPALYETYLVELLADLELGEIATLYPTNLLIEDARAILSAVEGVIDLNAVELRFDGAFEIIFSNGLVDYNAVVNILGNLVKALFSSNYLEVKDQAIVDYLFNLLEFDWDFNPSTVDWANDGNLIARALRNLLPAFSDPAWSIQIYSDLEDYILNGRQFILEDLLTTEILRGAINFASGIVNLDLIEQFFDQCWDDVIDLAFEYDIILPTNYLYWELTTDLSGLLAVLHDSLELDIITLINSGATEMILNNIELVPGLVLRLLNLSIVEKTFRLNAQDFIERTYGIAPSTIAKINWSNETLTIAQALNVLVDIIRMNGIDNLEDILDIATNLNLAPYGLLSTQTLLKAVDIVEILLQLGHVEALINPIGVYYLEQLTDSIPAEYLVSFEAIIETIKGLTGASLVSDLGLVLESVRQILPLEIVRITSDGGVIGYQISSDIIDYDSLISVLADCIGMLLSMEILNPDNFKYQVVLENLFGIDLSDADFSGFNPAADGVLIGQFLEALLPVFKSPEFARALSITKYSDILDAFTAFDLDYKELLVKHLVQVAIDALPILFGTSLMRVVYDVAMGYGLINLESEFLFLVEDYSFAEFKEDLDSLITILTLANQMNIVDFVQNDFQDWLFMNLGSAPTLVELVLNLNLLDDLASAIKAILYLAEIDVDVNLTGINWDNEKDIIVQIVTHLVDIISDISTLETIITIFSEADFLNDLIFEDADLISLASILQLLAQSQLVAKIALPIYDHYTVDLANELPYELYELDSIGIALVLRDVERLAQLIIDLVNANVVGIVRDGNPIDWAAPEIAEIIRTALGIELIPHKYNALMEYFGYYNYVLDFSKINLAHDADLIANAYTELIPILISTINPFHFYDDFTSFDAPNFFELATVAYTGIIIEALRILLGTTIASQLVDIAVLEAQDVVDAELLFLFEAIDSATVISDLYTILDLLQTLVNDGFLAIFKGVNSTIDGFTDKLIGNAKGFDLVAKQASVIEMITVLLNLETLQPKFQELFEYGMEKLGQSGLFDGSALNDDISRAHEIQIIIDVVTVAFDILRNARLTTIEKVEEFFNNLPETDSAPHIYNEQNISSIIDILEIIINSVLLVDNYEALYTNFVYDAIANLDFYLYSVLELPSDYSKAKFSDDLVAIVDVLKFVRDSGMLVNVVDYLNHVSTFVNRPDVVNYAIEKILKANYLSGKYLEIIKYVLSVTGLVDPEIAAGVGYDLDQDIAIIQAIVNLFSGMLALNDFEETSSFIDFYQDIENVWKTYLSNSNLKTLIGILELAVNFSFAPELVPQIVKEQTQNLTPFVLTEILSFDDYSYATFLADFPRIANALRNLVDFDLANIIFNDEVINWTNYLPIENVLDLLAQTDFLTIKSRAIAEYIATSLEDVMTIVNFDATVVNLVNDLLAVQGAYRSLVGLALATGLDIFTLTAIQNIAFDSLDYLELAKQMNLVDFTNVVEMVSLMTLVEAMVPSIYHQALISLPEFSYLFDLTNSEFMSDLATLALVLEQVQLFGINVLNDALTTDITAVPEALKEIIRLVLGTYTLSNDLVELINQYVPADMGPIATNYNINDEINVIVDSIDAIVALLRANNLINYEIIKDFIDVKQYQDEVFLNASNALLIIDIIDLLAGVSGSALVNDLFVAAYNGYVLPAAPAFLVNFLTIDGVDYTADEFIADISTILEIARYAVNYGLLDYIHTDNFQILPDSTILEQIVHLVFDLNLVKGREELLINTGLEKLGVAAMGFQDVDWDIEEEVVANVVKALVKLLVEMNVTDFVEAKFAIEDVQANYLSYLSQGTLGAVADLVHAFETSTVFFRIFLDVYEANTHRLPAELVSLLDISNYTEADFRFDYSLIAGILDAIVEDELFLLAIDRRSYSFPAEAVDGWQEVVNLAFDLIILDQNLQNFIDKAIELSGLNLSPISANRIDLGLDKAAIMAIVPLFRTVWVNTNGLNLEISYLANVDTFIALIDILELLVGTTLIEASIDSLFDYALTVLPESSYFEGLSFYNHTMVIDLLDDVIIALQVLVDMGIFGEQADGFAHINLGQVQLNLTLVDIIVKHLTISQEITDILYKAANRSDRITTELLIQYTGIDTAAEKVWMKAYFDQVSSFLDRHSGFTTDASMYDNDFKDEVSWFILDIQNSQLFSQIFFNLIDVMFEAIISDKYPGVVIFDSSVQNPYDVFAAYICETIDILKAAVEMGLLNEPDFSDLTQLENIIHLLRSNPFFVGNESALFTTIIELALGKTTIAYDLNVVSDWDAEFDALEQLIRDLNAINGLDISKIAETKDSAILGEVIDAFETYLTTPNTYMFQELIFVLVDYAGTKVDAVNKYIDFGSMTNAEAKDDILDLLKVGRYATELGLLDENVQMTSVNVQTMIDLLTAIRDVDCLKSNFTVLMQKVVDLGVFPEINNTLNTSALTDDALYDDELDKLIDVFTALLPLTTAGVIDMTDLETLIKETTISASELADLLIAIEATTLYGGVVHGLIDDYVSDLGTSGDFNVSDFINRTWFDNYNNGWTDDEWVNELKIYAALIVTINNANFDFDNFSIETLEVGDLTVSPLDVTSVSGAIVLNPNYPASDTLGLFQILTLMANSQTFVLDSLIDTLNNNIGDNFDITGTTVTPKEFSFVLPVGFDWSANIYDLCFAIQKIQDADLLNNPDIKALVDNGTIGELTEALEAINQSLILRQALPFVVYKGMVEMGAEDWVDAALTDQIYNGTEVDIPTWSDEISWIMLLLDVISASGVDIDQVDINAIKIGDTSYDIDLDPTVFDPQATDINGDSIMGLYHILCIIDAAAFFNLDQLIDILNDGIGSSFDIPSTNGATPQEFSFIAPAGFSWTGNIKDLCDAIDKIQAAGLIDNPDIKDLADTDGISKVREALEAINASFILRQALPFIVYKAMVQMNALEWVDDVLYDQVYNGLLSDEATWDTEIYWITLLIEIINSLDIELDNVNVNTIDMGQTSYKVTLPTFDVEATENNKRIVGLYHLLSVIEISTFFRIEQMITLINDSGVLNDITDANFTLQQPDPTADYYHVGNVVGPFVWSDELVLFCDAVSQAKSSKLFGETASDRTPIEEIDCATLSSVLESFNMSNILRAVLPVVLFNAIEDLGVEEWLAKNNNGEYILELEKVAGEDGSFVTTKPMTEMAVELELFATLFAILNSTASGTVTIDSIDLATSTIGSTTVLLDSVITKSRTADSVYTLYELLLVLNALETIDMNNLVTYMNIQSFTDKLGTSKTIVADPNVDWDEEIVDLCEALKLAQDMIYNNQDPNLAGAEAGAILANVNTDFYTIANAFNSSCHLRQLLPSIIQASIATLIGDDWLDTWLIDQVNMSSIPNESVWLSEIGILSFIFRIINENGVNPDAFNITDGNMIGTVLQPNGFYAYSDFTSNWKLAALLQMFVKSEIFKNDHLLDILGSSGLAQLTSGSTDLSRLRTELTSKMVWSLEIYDFFLALSELEQNGLLNAGDLKDSLLQLNALAFQNIGLALIRSMIFREILPDVLSPMVSTCLTTLIALEPNLLPIHRPSYDVLVINLGEANDRLAGANRNDDATLATVIRTIAGAKQLLENYGIFF